MPVTPYSTPIQYEYKPLNLQAFAAPLSKMQEQFDITTSAIQDTDFDLSHLPYGTDPERAKELIKVVQDKRDELAKNLSETKNYREAQGKIKNLQKLWQKDPELQALQSNYKLWQERDKEERERMNKGEISRDDYTEWKAREISKFEEGKGTSFKSDYLNPEGDYTPITGSTGRLKNLEKDLEELSWKVANAVPSQKRDFLSAAGIDVDTMDKKWKETIIDEVDPEKVAERTSAYLKTLPRFREWGKERADYKFDAIEGDKEQFNQTAAKLNNEYLQDVNSAIKDLDEKAKKDKTVLEGDQYKYLQVEKQKAEESRRTGEYDPKEVKNMFMQDNLADMYNMDALGRVLAKKDVTHNYQFRKLDDGSGSGSGSGGIDPLAPQSLFPAEDMKFNTSSIQDRIYKGNKSLAPTIKSINDISGGVMRQVVTEGYKGKSHDLGNYFEKQKAIQKAVIKSGDVNTFKSQLSRNGIKITEEQAYKLFNDLKAPNSEAMRQLNAGIKQGEKNYLNLVNSKESLNFVKEAAIEDIDITKKLAPIGSKSVGVGGLAISENVTKEQYEKMKSIAFPRNYKPEQLKKLKIDPNVKHLTYDQIAKLNGHKDFKTALINSNLFDGFQLYGGEHTQIEASKYKNELLSNAGKKGLQVNEMAFNIINDKPSQKALLQEFQTMGKVISYEGKEAFKNMPGFDSEGNPEEGTKLMVSPTKPPLATLHGGNMYFQVSYQHKGGEGTLTLTPKLGTEGFSYNILDRLDKATSNSNNEYDKTMNHTAKLAKWSSVHGNDINRAHANSPSMIVNTKEPEKSLGFITTANTQGNPIEAEVVKKYAGGGSTDTYYTLKIGKEYFGKYTDIDDLKIAMMGGTP